MIKNFASKTAEDIFNGVFSKNSKKIDTLLHAKIGRLFDQLDAATKVDTLRVPPSNHLEKLSGNMKDFWSIRVNKQWRVIFKWNKNDAIDVDVVDYH